jgi:cell shape-determining protein MreC
VTGSTVLRDVLGKEPSMYHRRPRKPSKPAVFAMLMALSGLLILLPREFFGSARSMTQLVALPGQYAVTRATEGVSQSADRLRAQVVPAQAHNDLLKAKQAVENENLSLREENQVLRNLVNELQQIRRRPQFPANGKLIPARVVGWDAVPGRDSMLLLKGRSPEVKIGDWVTSRLAIQAGTDTGVTDDARVLARQNLIGWIEQTSPYMSRVVLLSDRYANRVWRVHIAKRRPNTEPQYVMDGELPADFALEGIGNGEMRLLDINARLIEQGEIREGDVVTTDGHDARLPLAMVIGDIARLDRIKKQPLLYHAVVRHRVDPKSVSEVFVVDVSH